MAVVKAEPAVHLLRDHQVILVRDAVHVGVLRERVQIVVEVESLVVLEVGQLDDLGTMMGDQGAG